MNRLLRTALALTLFSLPWTSTLAGNTTAAPAAASNRTPVFGEVAAPSFGNVAAPQFGETAAPATGQATGLPATPKPAVTPASVPAAMSAASTNDEALPKPQASGWSGRYYRMESGALDKWDFLADGTFLHEGVAAGVGTGVRSSERGTYRLGQGWIELEIGPAVTAYSTAGALGAGTAGKTRSLRWQFRMLGKDGSQGIVLNHKSYKVRDWE